MKENNIDSSAFQEQLLELSQEGLYPWQPADSR